MQGLQTLLLTTLSRVPAFPELSSLMLSPSVAHICAKGQCFCPRQFIQQTSHLFVSCPYVLTTRTARFAWFHSTWCWLPGSFPCQLITIHGYHTQG